jgi:NAD(P)-dependent dehydrogenase (short-subunit alcohol dehydrogenase family)
MLLKDKRIIITGVGPGMGRKLAVIAASEGARVTLAARNAAFLQTGADEIKSVGGVCEAVSTDVSDETACHALVAAAVKSFGGLDGVVSSAYAPASYAPFEDSSTEVWINNMNVTCFGALRMARAALPALKERGGAIVNVTALAAVKPGFGQADYAVAKAALEGATRQLASEFGKYKIRVNATRMGWLFGAPLEGYFQYESQSSGVPQADLIKAVADRIALGMIPPDDECARTALMFVSDYTKMVTGAVLDVNGGEYFSA